MRQTNASITDPMVPPSPTPSYNFFRTTKPPPPPQKKKNSHQKSQNISNCPTKHVSDYEN